MYLLSALRPAQFLRNVTNRCSKSSLRNLSQMPKPKNPDKSATFGSVLKKFAIVTGTSAAILFSLYSLKQNQQIQRQLPIRNTNITPTESLRQKFNFIDKVVKSCASSVVYIEIRDNKKMDPETGRPQTISNGSGFIVRDDGWILTNAHVVINKPQSSVVVMLNDGTSYIATVEDADMNIDLALLKINSNKKLSYLTLGKSSDVSTGEWVIALGSPLSLSHSVTAGVVRKLYFIYRLK